MPPPFKPFFGADKPPLADLTTHTSFHRDLHFETTHDHYCGRNRSRRQRHRTCDNSTHFWVIFRPAGGRTPSIAIATMFLAIRAVNPDRGQPQSHCRSCFPEMGYACPVEPDYQHSRPPTKTLFTYLEILWSYLSPCLHLATQPSTVV